MGKASPSSDKPAARSGSRSSRSKSAKDEDKPDSKGSGGSRKKASSG
jgi:hypothetical protein